MASRVKGVGWVPRNSREELGHGGGRDMRLPPEDLLRPQLRAQDVLNGIGATGGGVPQYPQKMPCPPEML
ncbi:hypothetical protein NDU88_006974 [Pleurodeles waltl]|uniref:Uncharacterized protein n=1 Tax=Pleurodeles waltl TaxID=8319 RepID=A0AAV7LQQ4_PLEWA|nr:hypothetical protein NDU88_006974 [Pleurodeles waltl]